MLIMNKKQSFAKSSVIISYNESEILTHDCLAVIKGKVGSGKSRFCLNLIRGLLGKSDDLGFKYSNCPNDKYIYYISTEMSNYHLHKRYVKLVENLNETEESKLRCCNFYEEDSYNDLILQFKKEKPHMIIIDQIADFLPTINDEKESIKLVKSFSSLAKTLNCGIIIVIHQNEGSHDNSKSRGHLGSILEQKCISSIAVSKSNDRFKIKSTKIRDGKPFLIPADFNEKTDRLILGEPDKAIFPNLIFPANSGELKAQIMKLGKYKSSKASLLIKYYQEEDMIFKEREGKTWIYNKIESSNQPFA